MLLIRLLLISLALFSYQLFGEDDFSEDFSEEAETEYSGFEFTGFLELEQGVNTTGSGPHQADEKQNDWTMANRRFRVKTSKTIDNGGIFGKIDFIQDEVRDESKVDIRELRIQYTPYSWLDLSIGKQVSTWGVADMLFINDLFPKNWVANFQGRDMEAMKDSATAIRATSYVGEAVIDFVYHPKFAPDTTPNGCVFSVYDPNSRSLIKNQDACENSSLTTGRDVDDGELALSVRRAFFAYELALYGYKGFYKSPRGLLVDGNGVFKPYHPKLYEVGASIEGQAGPGILTGEIGYYYSKEDKDGDDPLIENSSLKHLLGYRIDLTANLSLGGQWYQEKMFDYDEYKESVGFNKYRKKEVRNTYTLRVTVKAQQETLWFSLFTYYRPEEKDSFTKVDINKRLSTNLSVALGVSIFEGDDNYLDRDFGMLKNDDNAFLRFKYAL